VHPVITTADLVHLNNVARSRDFNQWIRDEYFEDVADPSGYYCMLAMLPHRIRRATRKRADAKRVGAHYRTAWWSVSDGEVLMGFLPTPPRGDAVASGLWPGSSPPRGTHTPKLLPMPGVRRGRAAVGPPFARTGRERR
jgi:hypothetical protein